MQGPALVLVPNSGSQSKGGRFNWHQDYGTLVWQKIHLSTNITETVCTVHAILLHPCWGLATKWVYEVLREFTKTLQCKRWFFEMSNTSMYDATTWKELKCN
jgi:hypothetical protein